MQRRRATTKELEQGEKEMKEAQKRLEKEMKESGELQIDDGGKQTEGFESPPAALKDEARGSEEKPKGRKPKDLRPCTA